VTDEDDDDYDDDDEAFDFVLTTDGWVLRKKRNTTVPVRVGDCRDCAYLTGFVNLWCENEEACKAHHTNLAGRDDCKFWEEPEEEQEEEPEEEPPPWWLRVWLWTSGRSETGKATQ
jgi:hypothetical protein